ncbi:MAG: HEPN domain-containing protein [Burkholderiales bacterium]|nr:HEPN domain-containing protein [Burkholderiales bacterium]
MSLKRDEWERYRRQAEHTLVSAESDAGQAAFDWASFKAHQAADVALKGWVRARTHYATGHSVVRLLAEAGVSPPAELVDCARALDKVYIPARYPDAYDTGAPMDCYTQADARSAIECARRILGWLDDLARGESP